MTCATIQPRLGELRDGTLDQATATDVRAHLESCASCREELAFTERIRSEAGTLPLALDPPVDLWPGIEAAVSRRDARRLVPWLAAAAIVLLAGAGIIASQLSRTAEDRAATVIAMEEDY
ncbi:MAG: anti-sigma factor family protein, partial [Gemmatimonadales bacterium]